jgi:hypothetical protein
VGQVSKSDKEYMIGWLEGKIRAKIGAALSEHRAEVAAFREEATAAVNAAELGDDLRRIEELQCQINTARDAIHKIENKYYQNCGSGIHSRRDNDIENAVEAQIAAQGWGVGVLREQLEKVRVSLLFATTDASLQNAVSKLLQAAGLEEEL